MSVTCKGEPLKWFANIHIAGQSSSSNAGGVVGIQRGGTSASPRTARALLANVMMRRSLTAIMTIIIVVTGQDQDVSEKGKARKRTLKLGPISVQKVGEEDGNGFPIGIASQIQTIKRPPSDIQGLVTWGGGGVKNI